jgi:hypothetical protein
MLYACNFKNGLRLAEKAKSESTEGEGFWENLDKIIETSDDISEPVKNAWKVSIQNERKILFRLLSRFSLSFEQAQVLFNSEKRQKARISLTDQEAIENPYLLYERTRECSPDYQVSIGKVDKAVFPPRILKSISPLLPPSLIGFEDDQRRIRAIAISELERNATIGHTVYPAETLATDILELPIEPPCPVSMDIFNGIKGFLDIEIKSVEMKNKKTAYKLLRYDNIDSFIKSLVFARLDAKRNESSDDWREILNKNLDNSVYTEGSEEEKELENKAREEKLGRYAFKREKGLDLLQVKK